MGVSGWRSIIIWLASSAPRQAVVLGQIAEGTTTFGSGQAASCFRPCALHHARSSERWRNSFPAASISGLAVRQAQISLRSTPCVDRRRPRRPFRKTYGAPGVLAPAGPNQRIQAVPAAGTEAALYPRIELFRRDVAAELGLPYALASHFAPDHLITALEFHSRFKPSEQLDRMSIVGVNIVASERTRRRGVSPRPTESFTNIFRGARGFSQPPIDDIESYWTPMEKAQATRMLARSIIGSPNRSAKA